jgi:glutamine amidotransferase
MTRSRSPEGPPPSPRPLSTEPVVYVVHTGTANLASVYAAFHRLGVRPVAVTDPRDVERADALVLPGVGHFRAAMASLTAQRLVDPLRARVQAGRATLGICLGLQLLGLASDEAPGGPGVGAIRARCRRLERTRLPAIGWADVSAPWLPSGAAYFAHSYGFVLSDLDESVWDAATAAHAPSVVAAVRRGGVLACQFHPELSGAFGAALLDAWWRSSASQERAA